MRSAGRGFMPMGISAVLSRAIAVVMVVGHTLVRVDSFCRMHEGDIRLNIRAAGLDIIHLEVFPAKHFREVLPNVGVCCGRQEFQQRFNLFVRDGFVGGRDDGAKIAPGGL